MRIPLAVVALASLIACGGGDDAAPAEDPATMESAPSPASPTVADFYGTWETVATLEGTPEPVPVTLEGSAAGWSMILEDRDPVMLTASMSGDSLVTESDAYESVLRDGVTVRVRTAGVLVDGRMTGRMQAFYMTPEGEEVVAGTIEGVRGGGM